MKEHSMKSATSPERDIVSFRLAGRTYALPLSAVVQIIPMVALTPLPQAHDAVEGIMNYRGNAALIVNLRRYLNLPAAPLRLHTPIILLRTGAQLLGVIVDEVLDVTTAPALRIASLADIVPEGLGRISVLEGVLHTGQDAILLVSLPQLFARAPLNLLSDVPGNSSDSQPALVAEAVVEGII